jgi:hypothetical protein
MVNSASLGRKTDTLRKLEAHDRFRQDVLD